MEQKKEEKSQESGPILDFDPLREHVRTYFLKTLEQYEGDKYLMLDPNLKSFISFMVGKTEKGLFSDEAILEPGCTVETECPNIIFLVKSNLLLIKTIGDIITKLKETKKLVAFICPRATIMCKEVLEQSNVLGSIILHELPYELIPVEYDLLTLDEKDSFKGLTLGTNFMSLSLIKHSILRLEALYGKIPLKYAKGQWSCNILDSITDKSTKANVNSEEEENYSEIDALILLDRSVDPYTPLLTQQTYQGMIDEFFGIEMGYAMIDDIVLQPDLTGPTSKTKMPLTDAEDLMFADSKDLHFNMMKIQFPKKYAEMKNILENKGAAKTIEEMTKYLATLKNMKIPQLQKVFNSHMNLASGIDKILTSNNIKRIMANEPQIVLADKTPASVIEFLELQMTKCQDKTRLFRLLCFLSLTQNGLPKDFYNQISKEVIDCFGLGEMVRLMNMDRAGYMKRNTGSSNWTSIRNTFQLIQEEVDIANPEDIAYAYRGYAPLSVRLVERVFTGWSGPELDKIPGPKRVPQDDRNKLMKQLENEKYKDRKKVILVYYVGGVTFAELSCFRMLAKKRLGVKFVIATTQMINGNKIVDAFMDEQGNMLKQESLNDLYQRDQEGTFMS